MSLWSFTASGALVIGVFPDACDTNRFCILLQGVLHFQKDMSDCQSIVLVGPTHQQSYYFSSCKMSHGLVEYGPSRFGIKSKPGLVLEGFELTFVGRLVLQCRNFA